MNYFIYAIFDNVAGQFNQPFYMKSYEVAVRAVADALKTDPNFAKHVEDLSLYCLGTWNDESGLIISNKEFKCNLVSLLDNSIVS